MRIESRASSLEGVRSLLDKWERDESLPLRARVGKATAYVGDLARTAVYLRHADHVDRNVRVIGRPLVRNEGRLTVGPDVVLRSIVAPIDIYVGPGASLSVGAAAHLNSGVTIAATTHVEIGDRAEISPHVTIYDTSFHDLYDRNLRPDPRPVIIEDDVWLGTKCTVLPGVRIGRGAVVVAHALVTRNVEEFSVVSGVPAQVVARLDPRKFVVSAPEAGRRS
jgi:maltose O-acetyltransferase